MIIPPSRQNLEVDPEELTAQLARERADRDRAAVDEPVIRAEAQAELEAAAATTKPEWPRRDDDIELEI